MRFALHKRVLFLVALHVAEFLDYQITEAPTIILQLCMSRIACSRKT